MKRSISLLTVCLILVAASSAHAITIGSPAGPVELGGTVLSGSISYTASEIEDVDVNSKSFLIKAAFGPMEGISPYFRLGFTDLSVDPSFEGSLGFTYGGGAMFTLVRPQNENGLTLSLDTQVLWYSTKEGSDSFDVFNGQAALVGSVKSGGTVGFAGLATSFVNLDGGGGSLDESGMTHLFFGMDYFMDFNFFVNLEAHLFGEDSISLGVGYKF